MKKIVSVMMLFCLLAGCIPAGAQAADLLPAAGYDFDFVLRLHPEAFSEEARKKIDGYAALLEALRFRGSLVWAREEDNFDLHFQVIPVTRPEGAIEIRLHGPQDPVLLNSSLFGDKTIRLSTYSLLNFCSKMSEHLGIPLQYLGLAYPYSWLFGLKIPIEDWHFMMEKEEDGTIPAEWVRYLWDCWWWRVYDNEPLKILVDALCKDTPAEDAFRAVVAEIPDFFGKDFAQEREFHIRRSQTQTTWENYKGDIFFRKYDDGQNSGMELSLPRMRTGYLPVFSIDSTLNGEWRNSWITAGLLGQSSLPNLVNLKMSMIAFPTAWPADCSSLLSLDLTGTLLPNLGLSCFIAGEKNGHARIEFRKPTVDMEPGEIMMSVEGTLEPKEGSAQIEAFELDPEEEMLDLFIANDVTIQNYLPDLMDSLLKGVVRFLIGIPTSACQVIMDDLSELGIFTLLLGE